MMQLPLLPVPDQDIALVRVHTYETHSMISVVEQGRYIADSVVVATYDTREEALNVAVALRMRIRPIRRLLGRPVESMAV